jgi:Na+/phosphate symporter
MADSVVLIMGRIDDLLSDLKAQNIAGNAVATLERVNTTLATLQRTLIRVDKQDLGSKAASALTEVNGSAEKLNRILDVLGDSNGLVANANRATVALVEVGRTGQDTQKELEKTLRDIGEAADAVRGFVIELERDPDMLLKGKSPRTGSR